MFLEIKNFICFKFVTCIVLDPSLLVCFISTLFCYIFKGRVVEIYGPEASGKTTLALHVIAEAQKQGG